MGCLFLRDVASFVKCGRRKEAGGLMKHSVAKMLTLRSTGKLASSCINAGKSHRI